MTTPSAYNAAQIASGALTADHITELVRYWQAGHGLTVDGLAGPRTIASLAPPSDLLVVEGHWLASRDLGIVPAILPAHPSWYGGMLTGGAPRGIVAHYTATDPGTAVAMARRRARRFGTDPDDRQASWHISIEADGSIVQMVPLDHVAWHAGSNTARKVPGLGAANHTCIGIELVGHGREFPDAQVAAAREVWRALVRHYGIAREHAMITHQSIDPTRREDPGPVWMREHAPGVVEYAFG